MTAVNIQQFAQPYVGSNAAMQQFLIPSATEADLGDIDSIINNDNKFTGRMCWASDATTPIPVFALSGLRGANWVTAAGVVAYIP